MDAQVARRGSHGNGHGSHVTRYVAKYDYPEMNVKAGQVFIGIEAVPTNVAVTPVAP